MKTKNEKEIKIANYLVCLNEKCKNKDGCLRHLALQYNDKKHHFLKVINPLCYPHTNEVCPFFQSATKVRIVLGYETTIRRYASQNSTCHKAKLSIRIPNTTYYRYRNQVLPINPDLQEFIRKTCLSCGWDGEVKFDRYSEGYDW